MRREWFAWSYVDKNNSFQKTNSYLPDYAERELQTLLDDRLVYLEWVSKDCDTLGVKAVALTPREIAKTVLDKRKLLCYSN